MNLHQRFKRLALKLYICTEVCDIREYGEKNRFRWDFDFSEIMSFLPQN